MPSYLVFPAMLMTAAFVSYSYGVWGERLRRDLLARHVAAFWLGLVCDATGTERMLRLVRAGMRSDVHTALGAAAFALMLGHTLWATWVLTKGTPDSRHGFHRYSLVVWLVWLLPYVGGMVAGMSRGA